MTSLTPFILTTLTQKIFFYFKKKKKKNNTRITQIVTKDLPYRCLAWVTEDNFVAAGISYVSFYLYLFVSFVFFFFFFRTVSFHYNHLSFVNFLLSRRHEFILWRHYPLYYDVNTRSTMTPLASLLWRYYPLYYDTTTLSTRRSLPSLQRRHLLADVVTL